MKRIILAIVLIFLSIRVTDAQTVIYLPVILSENEREIMDYPILSISNGIDTINFLDSGSGIKLADPYWTPKTAQLKDGGVFVNPSNADGQALVAANYDNVVETIPLLITGPEGSKTIERVRKLFQMSVNAQNYYTTSFEQNQVYFAVKPKSDKFLTGYAAVYTMSIGELGNPFGAPFVNDIDQSAIENVNLIINREPFFSPLPPGQYIGPLYNIVKNSDFELWSNGMLDAIPDNWDSYEQTNITGTVNRSAIHKFNSYSMNINITGSAAANRYLGIKQTVEKNFANDGNVFTVVSWIKNSGITAGNGIVNVSYGTSDLELYNSSDKHEWTLFYNTFTLDASDDTIEVELTVLSNALNTTGNLYIDGLMILPGDWTSYIQDNLLAFTAGSYVTNTPDYALNVFNVPGDIQTPVYFDIMNNTSPVDENNQVEQIFDLFAGSRAIGTLDNFQNYFDPVGVNDVESMSGSSISASIGQEWTKVYSGTIYNNISDNVGKFIPFVRVYDEKAATDIEFRIIYYVSGNTLHKVVSNSFSLERGRHWELVYPDKFYVDLANLDYTQITYVLEAKRVAGSDSVKLDYFTLLASDLGILLAENLNPSVKFKNFLTVDNQGVNVAEGDTGFKILKNFSTSGIQELAIFNGLLYLFDANGDIWTYDTNVFQQVHTGGGTVNAAYVYNGKLHYNSNGTVYSTDGTNWPGDIEFTPGFANDMLAWDGKLFQTITSNLSVWNGTTETVVPLPNISIAFPLELYNGKLFVSGTTEPLIYSYDTSGVLTLEIDMTTVIDNFRQVRSLHSLNGLLWIGTDQPNHRLWYWDGVTLREAGTTPGTPIKFASLNERLYLISDQDQVYEIVNNNPVAVYDTEAILWYTMLTFNNGIYIGTNNIVSSSPFIGVDFTKSNYLQTDWEGGNFLVLPRKITGSENTQRYYFMMNRQLNVNNISDEMLTGISYKPQYFSLINKDDF